MKTTTIIFFQVFIFSYVFDFQAIFAQSDTIAEKPSKEKSSIKRYKNEIAIDLSGTNLIPFVNYSWSGYYYPFESGGRYSSLLYRRYKVKKKDVANSPGIKDVVLYANRLRLGTYFANNDLNKSISSTNSQGYNASLNLPTREGYFIFTRFGREIQENFGNFQLHYGLDVVIDYNRARNTEDYYQFNNDLGRYDIASIYEARANTLRFGLSPLIGFKYFLSSRISFSTEAVFDILYRFEKLETSWENKRPQLDLDKTETVVRRQGVLAAIYPIYTINLGFHF
ncbi:MAG: hypothetical protein MUE85_23705 [Microscillaceae bacterium]|jgi:hypothetical protein|nr:hypothetical protein [Microscillaceae bacterium]